MKVLLLNGSPNADGCTFTALSEVASALENDGVSTTIYQMGTKPVSGCIDCGYCAKVRNQCAIKGDCVNELLEMLPEYDGIVLGSPVYYASVNGGFLALLDRLFHCSSHLAHKPGAAICSARRAGTSATLDILHKYFTIAQMPVVSSLYWNMVHGNYPEEVRQDLEGMQIMRTLGHNMAWLMHCIEAGKQAGITPQKREERVWTNFVR